MTERSLAPRVISSRLPSGEAQWIWAAPDHHGVTPLAFQAARDFELVRPPAEAELLIQADEEYVLYLNATRVGGNRYRPGEPVDRYRVAPLLRPGRNRLLVQLASGRRAGGLLLRLHGSDGLEVVSGADWRILLRNRRRHLDPDRDLTQSYRPRVWGPPPSGRWRLPAAGEPQPLHDELLTGERRRAPRRMLADGAWQPLARPEGLPPGRPVTFDWGRQVVGYLRLGFVGRTAPEALLYFGREQPADPELEAPGGRALGPRGQPLWIDSLPRRFRYLTVITTGRLHTVFVLPAGPQRVAHLLDQHEPLAGVFGVVPPQASVSPIEYEIRRQLEGLPRFRSR